MFELLDLPFYVTDLLELEMVGEKNNNQILKKLYQIVPVNLNYAGDAVEIHCHVGSAFNKKRRLKMKMCPSNNTQKILHVMTWLFLSTN